MALANDVNYSDGNVRVFTRGIRDSVKKLEAVGVSVDDLKAQFRRIGEIVLRDVRPPVKTGALQASIRLSATKSASKIRVGGKKVPYAARSEFGAYLHLKNGGTTRIVGNKFLQKAIQRNKNKVVRTLARDIQQLFSKHGLGEPPFHITGYVANANYVHRK